MGPDFLPSSRAALCAQTIRLECESLGHLFGWQIYAKQEEIKRLKKSVIDQTNDELIDDLPHHDDILDIFKDNEAKILQLMDAQGFAFYAGSETIRIGRNPEVRNKLHRSPRRFRKHIS